MKTRIAALALWLASLLPVHAQTPQQYTLNDSSGAKWYVGTFQNLQTNKMFPGSVPVDAAGNPLAGTAGASNGTAMFVQGVANGTPVSIDFATPQHIICDSGCSGSGGGGNVNLTQILGAAPSASNPLWMAPATGAVFNVNCTSGCAGGGSGGNVNITQILGAAPSATNPLWVSPANGASFAVTGTFWPYSLGQQLATASVPVVLTAAQITALTPPTTVTVVQPTGSSLNATVSGSVGLTGTLPAFASTPTVNLGTIGGAATQTTLAAIQTALGSPLQAGGSIGNTSFGISGTLPAFASTPTFNIGTAPTLTVAGTVSVSNFPATQPVSGTVTANLGTLNGAATAALQTTGNTSLASILSTLAGNLTVVQPTGSNLHIVCDSGCTGGGGGGGTSSTFGATFPTLGTAAGMSQGGNMVALTGTSGNLNVQCANCSGSGVSTADGAAFTGGASAFAGSGGIFQTSATSNPVSAGSQGLFQMTANRALFINLRNSSGAEIGVSGASLIVGQPTASNLNATVVGTGTFATQVTSLPSLVAGSAVVGKVGIDQTTPGTTNLVAAGQSGTWNITNISGTITLPTGAASAANQTSEQAPVAFATATATKSVLIGAQFLTTQPTLSVNTQQGSLLTSARGELLVAPGVSGFSVTNGGTFAVQAAQSGTWNVGLTGTLPAFASTPTVNLGTIGGAATQTTLAAIQTALGSPFQAGGSIGNTSFGISGTLPAFASTPTFNLGTLNGAATATNQTSQITQETATASALGTPTDSPCTLPATTTACSQTAIQKALVNSVTNPVTLGSSTGGMNVKTLAALTNTAVAVKGSAGQVYKGQCYNPHATDSAALELFNSASVTLGTTPVADFVEIGPGQSAGFTFSLVGEQFSAAISAAAVKTIGGSTAPSTALDCTVAYN